MKDFRQSYAEDGFVCVPQFLNAEEIATIEEAIEKILDQALLIRKADLSHTSSLDEKWIFLKKNYPKIKSHAYDLIKHLNQVLSLSTSQKMYQYISPILGSNFLIDKPQIRFDDGDDDRLLPMHQEVYGQINYASMNVWIPFMDTEKGRGGLAVIPGSHKLGLLPHQFYGDMNNSHGVRPEFLSDDRITVMKINAGDALFFDSYLIHGSTPNKSELIRKTFVSRFNKIEGTPYLSDGDVEMFIAQNES